MVNGEEKDRALSDVSEWTELGFLCNPPWPRQEPLSYIFLFL